MEARRAELKKDDNKTPKPFIKKRYMKTIEKYEILRLWRDNELKAIISELKLAKLRLKSGIISTTKWLKYEVLTTEHHNNDVLILRNTRSNSIIEVVSAEDSFDLFHDIHQATGHGDKDTMLQIIRQRYHISNLCLNIFLENCPVCSADKKIVKMPDNNFSHSALVSLLDFTNQRDGEFAYVLVYKIRWSGFSLIRPITISDWRKDASLELLNIFLDFGPPFKILVRDSEIDKFQSILNEITSTTCDFNIFIERNVRIVDELFLHVTKYVNDYIEHSPNKNWSLACHLMQWKVNNSVPLDLDAPIGYDTPYKAHFKSLSGEITRSPIVIDEEQK